MLTEASALIRYNLELSVGGNPSPASYPLSIFEEIPAFSPFQVTNESGYRSACASNAEENESDEEEEEGRATRAVILDLPLFAGSLASRCVGQDIAAGLRADVVHITSNSIARLLECPLPLASDGVRIPTDPISKLRFRVAERSGWLNSAAKSLAKPKYANARALNRRYLESIYTQGRITSDSEEREWGHCDNLKVDAGLAMIREMRMSSEAQNPTHQLRPILIHIHDFNALFMDESDVLKQILLWTDSLRSDGCKVSVIGTGSISRAYQQHWHFMDLELASTEGFRVISLPSSLPGIDSTALEERESLLCNAEMIAKLIAALHEPQDVDSRPLVREYQSEIVEHFDDYPLLRRGVLPLQLVERIATAAVGNLKAHAETGPVAVARLRQALSESLSLFARNRRQLCCRTASIPKRGDDDSQRARSTPSVNCNQREHRRALNRAKRVLDREKLVGRANQAQRHQDDFRQHPPATIHYKVNSTSDGACPPSTRRIFREHLSGTTFPAGMQKFFYMPALLCFIEPQQLLFPDTIIHC